jgi:nucleoside-diphosphate-sugar epimerase
MIQAPPPPREKPSVTSEEARSHTANKPGRMRPVQDRTARVLANRHIGATTEERFANAGVQDDRIGSDRQPMTEARALVTGATGMVGSAIVRALLERKRLVRVFARDRERARILFGAAVEIAEGSLQDLESMLKACCGVEEIYHIAGAVDTRTHGDAAILDTNVEGTRRLLQAADAHRVSRMVYTSSISVYGDNLPLGVTEDASFNPAGIYGVSKVRAERLVQDAVAAGLCARIVRPCIVYGPGDRYFMRQAAEVLKLPVVPLPDGGRHRVDVVHADDLARAHLLVMEAGKPGAAYNVTDGNGYRAGDIIRWMAEALNRSPWLPSVPRWLADSARPMINAVGRWWGKPDLALLRRQDINGFFSDYHFDISRIRALGYTAHIRAPVGLRMELNGRAQR